MTPAEQTGQLKTPMLGVGSANVARMWGFIQSETSVHVLYDDFLRERFGGFFLGGSYRSITPLSGLVSELVSPWSHLTCI